MDGNGRWAVNRHLPRTAGHAKGVRAVRKVVEYCRKNNVSHLTLLHLARKTGAGLKTKCLFNATFVQALEREVAQLKEHGVRLRVIGDLSKFDSKLQGMIEQAQHTTAANDKLHLTIAANYGGRWDILQATKAMLENRQSLLMIHRLLMSRHWLLTYA